MSDYIFEIGLVCLVMTLVGVFLTVAEFRRLEARKALRNKDRDLGER